MKLFLRPLLLFGVSLCAATSSTAAQGQSGDIYFATVPELLTEVQSLFGNPDGTLLLSGYNIFAEGITANCPGELPINQQIGLSRGFAGVNGFVISNGFLEDVDGDGASFGSPTGCISPSGSMGFPFCTAVDPLLASIGPTEDAIAFRLTVRTLAPMELDLAYEFVTHEDPTDPAFFDAFGLFLNGQMLAGGASNSGPVTGTDSWTLFPSTAGPFEFQEFPGVPRAVVPAFRTGRRIVTVSLPVGTHQLDWHVADSGPPQFCGTGASDSSVISSLFFGLHTWRANDAASYTPGIEIDWQGHPAPDIANGGAFPPDFQVTLAGAPPNTFASLVRGPVILRPGALLPAVAPLQILVGPNLLIDTTEVVDVSGRATFPNPPIPIPAALRGRPLHFQWFGLDPVTNEYYATKAVRAKF